MGKKIHDCTCGAFEDSCLDNTKPGEPIFVLRAHDKLAPPTVRDWIQRFATAHKMRDDTDGSLVRKLHEANEHVLVMEAWPDRKVAD